jgi:superfamily I DNA/RNA helicase
MTLALFDDKVVDRKDMVTLCSAHRSKGLEWHRVFILGLYELMGRECKQDWQTQQELNLQYVAVTRSQDKLFNVTGVKEEKKQHNLEAA